MKARAASTVPGAPRVYRRCAELGGAPAELPVRLPADVLPGEPSSRRDAEIAGLVAAAKRGETSALEALYLRYRPLIAGLVAEAVPRLPVGLDPDDVAQEAAEQLLKLVQGFDSARGVNLTTHLQKTLRWRVANYLRAEARRTGHLPLRAAPLHRLADDASRPETPDPPSPRLASALRRLSPRQRTIIAGLYWRDRTAAELAKELSVTPQAVTALRRRAEARLRKALGGPDAPPDGS